MSLYTILKDLMPKKPPTCTAVIAAAGISVRCEGEDKLLYAVCGKPVIAHTIEVFENCRYIKDVVVVTHEDKIGLIGNICKKYGFNKVSFVIKGGKTRLESVINGIYAASKKTDLIAIHDGARPCLDDRTLIETIKKASLYNAAAPVIAVTSTVKKVVDGIITETIDREDLYEVQTPQIFRQELIKAALINARKKSITITDDCMAVELLGANVYTVEGSRMNIKITKPEDFELVKSFLEIGKK